MDLSKTYLKSLVLAQLLLEANDELEGSAYYDTRLKTDVIRLEKTVVKQLDKQYRVIYNVDPALMHNIQSEIEKLVDRIACSSIDDLVTLNLVIEKYIKNNNWFLENIDLKLKPLKTLK